MASIVGVSMAQPLRQAAAQEQPHLDARTAESVRDAIVPRLEAIRSGWAAMQRDSLTRDAPRVVAEADPNLRPILETLATNAAALNIPVTGTTPQARFRSLNNWLNSGWSGRSGLTGRNQDSPVDEAALNELQLRLNIALGQPGAAAVADGVLPNLGVQQPAAPPTTVTPQQAPQQAAPALTAERRTEYQSMVESLDVIARNGASAAQKTQAARYRAGLQRILDNQSPTERQLRDAETNFGAPARRLLFDHGRPSRALADAQRRAAIQTGPADAHVPQQQVDVSVASVQSFLERMQAIARDTSKPQSVRDMATDVANRLSNIWLLGERAPRQEEGGNVSNPGQGPRWDLFAQYQAAGTALEAGNEADARAALQRASTLFDREQAFIAQRMQTVVLGSADALLGRDIPHHLPDRAALRGAQLLQTVRIRGSRTSTDNSAESIDSALRTRITDARRYIQANTGRLSFNYMFDLEQFVQLYSDTVGRLMDFYDYAAAHGGTTGRTAVRVMRSFATAQRTLVDPEFNPYNSYPPELKRLMRQEYGRAIGNPNVTDAEVSAAIASIPQWRYDTELYRVYNEISQLAPQLPTEVSAAATAQAKLRAARIFYDREYIPYRTGEFTNAAHRFQDAQAYLRHAVTIVQQSGLPEDVMRPLLTMAQDQLRFRANPANDDQRRASADLFVDMAVDMTAICEAELLIRTPGLRPSSLGASSSAVRSARGVVDEARAEFTRGFSVPQVSGPQYPVLSRYDVDEAIRQLSPPAITATEGHARYTLIQQYDNARPNVTTVYDSQPDVQLPNPEHDTNRRAPEFITTKAPPPEDALWTAMTQDRDAALTAAMDTEVRHMRMLVSLRDEAAFGRATTQGVMGQTPGLAALDSELDMRVSRTPEDTLTVSWWRRLTRDRADMGSARVSIGGRMRDRARERTELFTLGHFYVELERQEMLSQDQGSSILLRGLDAAPNSYGQAQKADTLQRIRRLQDAALRTRLEQSLDQQYNALRSDVQAIARRLGLPLDAPFLTSVRNRMLAIASDQSMSVADQQREVNRLLVGVLDVRIAELSRRLERGRRTTDGALLSDLEHSTDPTRFYIVRARQGLEAAQRLRTSLNSSVANPLFEGRIDPRAAIMTAENALASLREENIAVIPVPPVQQPTFTAYVASSDINVERLEGNPRRVRFTANKVTVRQTSGAETTLAAYERANGRQNLTYYWFMYQDLGRTDSSGEPIMYLLNPDYRESGQPRYLGQIMRNVRLSDGTRGDFLVRVRSTGLAPSTGPEWAPVQERDGTVRVENALYQVRSGTLEPVRDARLEQNMVHQTGRAHVCRERASGADTVIEYGPTTPVLIVRPSATRTQQR
jgi:hypothetical protein